MLRRPFSIGGLRREGAACLIDILGRVVGAGTAWLDALKVGDHVDLIGPLGGGFTEPPAGHRALLVAGGIGLPPIRWLGEALRNKNVECRAIYGAQSRDLMPVELASKIPDRPEFSMAMGKFSRNGILSIVTTDDGSAGMRGRVTEALIPVLANDPEPSRVQVYACGPEPMLKAVGSISAAHGARCEVAMERVMGCGMSTCQSCVVPVKDSRAEEGWRYALCCREGPVFDAATVLW
ncbi:MAG TPA: dihydroorotate dehydrogenase electron transfer subunit [Phycisphaerae bacterium]|nr:dihydroorotate dehydrogenase electron transfer subunit [Phycisphaerae bacterium]